MSSHQEETAGYADAPAGSPEDPGVAAGQDEQASGAQTAIDPSGPGGLQAKAPWKSRADGKTVFRREAPFIFCWIWIAFVIFNVIQVVIPDHDYFSIELTVGLLGLTGLAYACGFRPRVVCRLTRPCGTQPAARPPHPVGRADGCPARRVGRAALRPGRTEEGQDHLLLGPVRRPELATAESRPLAAAYSAGGTVSRRTTGGCPPRSPSWRLRTRSSSCQASLRPGSTRQNSAGRQLRCWRAAGLGARGHHLRARGGAGRAAAGQIAAPRLVARPAWQGLRRSQAT